MSRNLRRELAGMIAVKGNRRRVSRSRDLIRSLESLENRTLLSGGPTVYTVDLTSSSGASTAADAGDIRYVISQADLNPNLAGSVIQFGNAIAAGSPSASAETPSTPACRWAT